MIMATSRYWVIDGSHKVAKVTKTKAQAQKEIDRLRYEGFTRQKFRIVKKRY
jgi:hypothetical protein